MKSLIVIWAVVFVAMVGVWVFIGVQVANTLNTDYIHQSEQQRYEMTINPQKTTNPQETTLLQDTVAPYENVRK